ncbi:MAG: hypothetical protein JWM74_26 [Myxococcaceae bacterium]|jgi:uncharacterized protein YecE (DUF72 family)|nr:hypothetical protein [Myxococcaceae bacterium]
MSRIETPRTRVGISGWIYPRWRGAFYPKKLPQKSELAYAAGTFDSIEINGSFYSLQRPSAYARWYDETPADFEFAVKGGRFITHMKKLNDVHAATANFFASGVLRLREKLGPILWQFPPNLGFDEPRFRAFFELLPKDTLAASRLARRHDDKVKGRCTLVTDACRPVRHAVEVRHPSFCDPRFIALLREHRIALVVADTAQRFPYLEDVTADFVYVRLHGDAELYVSGYEASAIAHWARRVRAWRDGREPGDARLVAAPSSEAPRGRDVYVYFDNDAKVRAPFDAIALQAELASSVHDARAAG